MVKNGKIRGRRGAECIAIVTLVITKKPILSKSYYDFLSTFYGILDLFLMIFRPDF